MAFSKYKVNVLYCRLLAPFQDTADKPNLDRTFAFGQNHPIADVKGRIDHIDINLRTGWSTLPR
jgi:hypothetical protein